MRHGAYSTAPPGATFSPIRYEVPVILSGKPAAGSPSEGAPDRPEMIGSDERERMQRSTGELPHGEGRQRRLS